MRSKEKQVFLAEFIGTIIVSIGNSFVKTYYYDETQSGSLIPILGAVFIAIILFSDFSGSHFNTAVTILLYLIEENPLKKAELLALMPFYIIAQFLAGIVGGLTSALLYDGNIQIMKLAEGFTHIEGFMFEFLGSLLFYCLLVVNTYNEKHSPNQDKALYAFISVMGLGVGNAVSCHYTVAGVNPAVATGFIISRMLVTEKYYQGYYLWFYNLAPICAAIMTSYFYFNVYKYYFEKKEEEKLGEKLRSSLLTFSSK